MIKLNRIKLEELGELGSCGIPGDALRGLTHTGEEFRKFLDGYVTANPDREGWPDWKKCKVNHLLFAILRHQTQDHCSMCDGHPMKDAMTAETIEHFHPKAGDHARPDLRLTWENLFCCCSGCQSAKGTDWSSLLLKPDEPDYDFHRYFSCEFTTGKIAAKRRACKDDKEKAKETIRIYNLNRQAGQRQAMVDHHPYYGISVPLDLKPFRYWVAELEVAKA